MWTGSNGGLRPRLLNNTAPEHAPRGHAPAPGPGSGPGYALVSGDFVKTGGMDRANYALASYLARRGHPVHLVAHRADDDLMGQGPVAFHRVPKPLGSYLLAEPLLDRAGRRWAARVASAGGRVVVNGGNCAWGDVNWVHYVHAAWPPRGGQAAWT